MAYTGASGIGDRVGQGGLDWGGWVEVGGGTKLQLLHPWSTHDARTMLYATLVGHRGSGSNLT